MKLVSECGVNWKGDISLAKIMIARSREAGADAVKFQWFGREQLEGRGFDEPTIQKLLKNSMDRKTAKELKVYAEDIIGIEWFCTPFNMDATLQLLEMGVKHFKVRYMDATKWYHQDAPDISAKSLPDHVKMMFFKGKQIIMTIGGKPPQGEGMEQIQWLYAVPKNEKEAKYGATKEDIDWEAMKACKGFSCHVLDMSIWTQVRELNLDMVEVHTTIERDGSHFDDSVSYTFDELREICSTLSMKDCCVRTKDYVESKYKKLIRDWINQDDGTSSGTVKTDLESWKNAH